MIKVWDLHLQGKAPIDIIKEVWSEESEQTLGNIAVIGIQEDLAAVKSSFVQEH